MSRLALLLGVAIFVAGPALGKTGQGKSRPPHAGVCPPGLAKKNPACMPPGRYKKLFEVGQRVPYNFQGLTGYEGLPRNVRQRYGPALDPQSRYIYDQGTIYRVDPTTMAVSQILQFVTR